MTQAEQQEAFFARADQAHQAAMEQLAQNPVFGSARAWREAYIAAFTTYWFIDVTAQTAIQELGRVVRPFRDSSRGNATRNAWRLSSQVGSRRLLRIIVQVDADP
jgi:hypothetical protein